MYNNIADNHYIYITIYIYNTIYNYNNSFVNRFSLRVVNKLTNKERTMDEHYYAAVNNEWHYLGIDADPPSGKIHVLTDGGISVIGDRNTKGIIAWSPLMKRDKEKEALQKQFAGDHIGLGQASIQLRETCLRQNKDVEQEMPTGADFTSAFDFAKAELRILASQEEARLLPEPETVQQVRAPVTLTTAVAEAMKVSHFTNIKSCCNVEDKFCANDEYKGDLRVFSKAFLAIYKPSSAPSKTTSNAHCFKCSGGGAMCACPCHFS